MTVLGTRAPARAPGVELLGELTGSGYREARCLVRRADGQTLHVTPLLYQLLDALDGERDAAALAAELSRRIGKTAAPEDVQYLLESKLRPLGVLLDDDGAAPAVQKAEPLLGIRPKVVVTDPAVTRRLTAPFAWLFRTWVVVPVLLAFAAAAWWVLVERGLAQATRQALYEPHLLLAVVGLTVLSAGFHEFGHAAACRYGGATPGAMGAGLYLVWPAFYTDVDDSYRLSRWGRLRVDLGGLYFNALVAVAVTGAWFVWREDALLLGVATQLLQMVRQLAPFIRADGYHILADLTGVPDLFAHMKPTLLGLLPQNWGKPQPLKRWARAVVTTWVLVVVPLLLGLLVMAVLVLPRLIATAVDSLGRQVDGIGQAAGGGDVVRVLVGALAVLALLVPIAAICYLLVRVVRRTATRVWSLTDGRPRARAAAVLAAALLGALVAWAWWPAGQYQPVRADERGTLPGIARVLPGAEGAPVLAARAVPQTALALVPRGDAAATSPTLLLVRDDDGALRSVLLDGARDGRGSGVAFPFAVPKAPGEGDNQALVMNDEDGSTVYDVAVALVWVEDGEVVDNRNEAYALASCRQCTTVAVAFQVVLSVGQADVVTPVNTAVAGNASCVECLTTALAVQLVATLRELPSEDVQAQLEQALARLGDLEGVAVTDLYAQVKAVEDEVLRILVENDLVEGVETRVATASPSPLASAGASSGPASAEPTASSAATTSSTAPSPAGSASPTGGAATPGPTASQPAPSPSP